MNIIFMGTFSVDSFFFISGFLMSFLLEVLVILKSVPMLWNLFLFYFVLGVSKSGLARFNVVGAGVLPQNPAGPQRPDWVRLSSDRAVGA